MKRFKVIINNHIFLFAFILFILFWQIICMTFNINSYILPSPVQILYSFISNFTLIIYHASITLLETIIGLFISIIIGVIIAIIFNEFKIMKKIIFPFIIIFQTLPLIAIAPLLVMWLGIGISSKITLIIIICSFPIITNLTNAFENVDIEKLNYFKSLNSSKINTYRYLYFNETLEAFFSSLKISITYSVTSAILSEYIGSKSGLGVLLNNSFNSYNTELVFAVIISVSVLTLTLIKLNDIIYKYVTRKEKI